SEMDTIKSALGTTAQPFREHADKWLNAVYASESSEGTLDKFLETVLPYTEALQGEFEKNELIKHISRLQGGKVQIAIMLGELPVAAVWNYYRQLDVISDETWAILEKELEKDEFKNRRYPVMVMQMPPEIVPDELEIPSAKVTDTIKPVKKSIEID